MLKNLEPQLKAILINHLKEKKLVGVNDIIINEFNTGDFSRRVDLALINDNHFLAYEIKSDSDTLQRLEDQVKKYLEYFDKVTVITTPKHTNKALLLIPNNVALWELNDKTLEIKVIQKGRLIKVKDKLSMIQLMIMKDLKRIVKENGGTISYNRAELEKKLLLLPTSKLRRYALQSLINRFKKVNILNGKPVTHNSFNKRDLNRKNKEGSIATQLDTIIATLYRFEIDLKSQSNHSSSVVKSDKSVK